MFKSIQDVKDISLYYIKLYDFSRNYKPSIIRLTGHCKSHQRYHGIICTVVG